MIDAVATNVYTWYIWRDISIALASVGISVSIVVALTNYWNRRR